MIKKTTPFERADAIEKEDTPIMEGEFQDAQEALNEVLETGRLRSTEEFGVNDARLINKAVEEKIAVLNDELNDAASGADVNREEVRRISKQLGVLEEQQEALVFEEKVKNTKTLYELFDLIDSEDMVPSKELMVHLKVKDIKMLIETAFKKRQNPELFNPFDIMEIIPEDFGLRDKVEELLNKEE